MVVLSITRAIYSRRLAPVADEAVSYRAHVSNACKMLACHRQFTRTINEELHAGGGSVSCEGVLHSVPLIITQRRTAREIIFGPVSLTGGRHLCSAIVTTHDRVEPLAAVEIKESPIAGIVSAPSSSGTRRVIGSELDLNLEGIQAVILEIQVINVHEAGRPIKVVVILTILRDDRDTTVPNGVVAMTTAIRPRPTG